MKKCPKCTIPKPTTEFYRDKSTKDGYTTQCKSHLNISSSTWKRENSDKSRQIDTEARLRRKSKAKLTRQQNSEKLAKKMREWTHKNSERALAIAKKSRDSRQLKIMDALLRKKFGISLQDKEHILVQQNNECAICRTSIDIHCDTDHIHGSKPVVVRGLLCGYCNRGIGHFKDSSKLIEAAIRYLQKTLTCIPAFPLFSYLERKERILNSRLKAHYGSTFGLAQYRWLVEIQQGACAVCTGIQSSDSSRMSVDHVHETKQVRGLLCTNCNVGLGLFREDVDVLRKAILYLSKSVQV